MREFLSLYALTRNDIGGNGTWEEIPVKNGESVRAALFGSGSLLGDLISEVHIGGAGDKQNPYANIERDSGQAGIKATPVQDHQHHFHVYLSPPNAEPIDTTRNLLTDMLPVSATGSATPPTLQTEAQGLLDYAQTLTEGEELMFTMDVPYVPAQDTPIVLAQAAYPWC